MGGQRRTRAAVAAQDRSEDAPLASLAGGSSKDSCSSQRSGSQHDMEAHAAGRDHEAGPEAPHPGKLCRPKLGCAKCRSGQCGCERCQDYFENYTYYEAQKVAGQQASSVEEVHVEVKPVAEHPACEGAEPESVRVKVEVTVTPSPKQKGRKGRPGRLASSLQELDMENDCLAPLLRVLVLPAPSSGSAVIAGPTLRAASQRSDCLHPLLCQHLRISIAVNGMATAIQKAVAGKPRMHRPQIQGQQYWVIRKVPPRPPPPLPSVYVSTGMLYGIIRLILSPAATCECIFMSYISKDCAETVFRFSWRPGRQRLLPQRAEVAGFCCATP